MAAPAKSISRALSPALWGVMLASILIARPLRPQESETVFRSQTDLVLVNVTVKDKHGKFVRDLKPEDFTVLEDNKQQKVVSFDTENIDSVLLPEVAQTKPLEGLTAPKRPNLLAQTAKGKEEFKDRRLLILFFDLSAMQPDEIEHAVSAAENYLDHQ